MSEPSAAALAEMGLLAKRQTIQTAVVGIGDHARRKTYLDKFNAKYKDVEGLCNVKWSADSGPTAAACRCNGNLILLEMGARAPQTENQQAINIPNTYVLPKKTLGDWSKKHLRASPPRTRDTTDCSSQNLQS